MKKITSMSLNKWLMGIVAAFIAFLVVIVLVMQNYFAKYVSDLYQSNVNITMAQVASEVQDTFTNMNEAVRNLADNTAVQDYVAIRNSEDRYKKVSESIISIVKMAIANKDFDHLLIADATYSWFEFTPNVLSQASTRVLQELYWDDNELINTVVTLEGETYFCTVMHINELWNGEVQTAGLVVALTGVDRTRSSLQLYTGYDSLSIVLHDFQNIIVSLDESLEGTPLSELAALQGQHYVLEETVLSGSLGIVISVPYTTFYPHRNQLAGVFLGVGGFAVIALLLLAFFISRMLVRPFQKVIEGTRRLGTGNDSTKRLEKTGVEHVDALVQSINSMLIRLEEYKEREFNAIQEIYELEISQQRAQMYLLRNQINRHFLYNSLISIRALAESGQTEKAGKVAAGIAKLLQYTSSKAEEVNLFDEMEIIKLYVQIQNIRFDNRIVFDVDVDDRLCEYKTLKLIIQPLVENAVTHGLEPRTQGGKLHIRGFLHEGIIYIEVRDNGAGIPDDKLKEIQHNLSHVETLDIIDGLEGIALMNVQKRINAAYGTKYGITINSEFGKHTIVRLCVPALPDE